MGQVKCYLLLYMASALPYVLTLATNTTDPHFIIKNDLASEGAYTFSNLKRFTSEPGFDLTDEEMKKFKIWPRGVIPYYIDQLSYDKPLRDKIRLQLEEANNLAGLRFTEMSAPPVSDDNKRWVLFVNRRAQLQCSDYHTDDFSNTGPQRVVLGYDCLARGGAVPAAVLAIAGVPPQHNSPNRETYIHVDINNVLPEKVKYFKILRNDEWLFHDVPYDFNSVGHYSFYKHSKNGSPTVFPQAKVHETVGEKTTYSEKDIWKLRMLYNFITRKEVKDQNLKVKCAKLLKPGPKYKAKHKKEALYNRIPRPKPAAYLNLSDKNLENNEKGDETDEEKDGQNEQSEHSDS